MCIGREEYEHCKGRFLRVTKTVMIAIIVEANPKDKAMISLVETGSKISHVTRLRDFFNAELTHFVTIIQRLEVKRGVNEISQI
jgi:hypothetical protein